MYFLSTVAKHNFVISKTKRVIYFCVQTRSVVFDGKGGGIHQNNLDKKKNGKSKQIRKSLSMGGGGRDNVVYL